VVTPLLGGALVRAGVPVTPDEETAREWVETELRDPVYAANQPGLLQRAITWVLERLGAVDGAGPSLWFWVVALAVVALVVVLVVRRVGAVRGAARTGSAGGEVGVDPTVSADEYRRRAGAAATAGDWRTAVLEQFRATVRSLEERTVLEPRPGRTADEAASEAGALLPDRAADLAEAARVFDDVCYGDREAGPEQHRRLAETDAAVLRSRLAVGAP
jgi:hypothetical protein